VPQVCCSRSYWRSFRLQSLCLLGAVVEGIAGPAVKDCEDLSQNLLHAEPVTGLIACCSRLLVELVEDAVVSYCYYLSLATIIAPHSKIAS